jgi:hypothetical protein
VGDLLWEQLFADQDVPGTSIKGLNQVDFRRRSDMGAAAAAMMWRHPD